jgi:colanic acid biosynthesis glycosyl transferase WcaI
MADGITRVVLLNQYYAPDEAATAQMLADLGVGLARESTEPGETVRHQVVVIASDRSYADSRRRYQRRDSIDGIQIERVGTTAFGRASRIGRSVDYLLFFLSAARKLLFGRKADVIVTLTTPPFIALAPLLIGRLRRVPTILWSMDVYPDIAFELGALRRGSLAGFVLHRAGRWILRSADLVIALGDTMAGRLREQGASKVEVVQHWAIEADRSVERTIIGVAGEQTRRDWEWGDRFVVMYSGNMGLAHHFSTVIDAAAEMERSGERGAEDSEVIFSFVGGGPQQARVQRAALLKKLSRVEFRGYVRRENLVDSLSAPDVHLVTLREKMPGLLVPSKIYGILAAGKPTIYVGPDYGEVSDILREGACGIRVAIGDVGAFVAAVERYRNDPGLAARHGANARELYQRRFTREKSVGRLVELIGGIARRGQRP